MRSGKETGNKCLFLLNQLRAFLLTFTMMKKQLTFFFVFLTTGLFAQDNFQVNVKYTSGKITIDGVLDEPIWQESSTADDFFKNKPTDTAFAESKTEVRLAYNDKFVFVSAICYDNNPGKYIVQSLKRDFSYPRTDAFVVFFDTYSDGNTGFSFACSPYGSQREGTLSYGGKYGVSTSWDNKWYSATKRTDSLWTVEMAIPFNTLRFKEGIQNWKVNFSRNDQKQNEMSTWVPVPINFNVANLAFTGNMTFEEPLKKNGANVSLIPYIATRGQLDYQQEDQDKEQTTSADIGGIAKIGVTSALNLDLAINPDFSDAEVDDQVTDLSRFEINFPEKRQLFLENSDLFGNYGYSTTNPFYSRRIGLDYDTSRKAHVPIPILFGARLSGKLDQNWRLGVLSFQTAKDENAGVSSQNYSMVSIQRKVFARSNWGFFMINRQGWASDSLQTESFNNDDYNRVIGSDFFFQSKNGELEGKTYYHQSFTPELKESPISTGLQLKYDTKKIITEWKQEYVGKDFKADVGYVPRSNYWRFQPSFEFNMFPSKGVVNWHAPSVRASNYTNTAMESIDRYADLGYKTRFLNTSEIEIYGRTQNLELQRDFNPSKNEGLKLEAGSRHLFNNFNIRIQSDERKQLFFKGNSQIGEYYNGNRVYVNSELRFRVSPWGNLSLRYAYNDIKLPQPYSSAIYHLLGPKLEITFTDKIYFTTYLQYNSQSDNININSRFQWRFKPSSDFFIVYTENYFPESLSKKNKAIVLKLNYWFNL